MPIEPAPTSWVLPDPRVHAIAGEDVVGIGADLEPGTVLAGYRQGIFGMHVRLTDDDDQLLNEEALAWWSPEQRGVIPLDSVNISRSLRKSLKRFEIRINTAFSDVVTCCRHGVRPGDRDGEWINDDYVRTYTELHRLGWAHSVEAWAQGELAGGLICIEIGGLVCGESMFSRTRDASKAALVGLVNVLNVGAKDVRLPGGRLLDVQWVTEHLASLGAVAVPRHTYVSELLPIALALEPVLSAHDVRGGAAF